MKSLRTMIAAFLIRMATVMLSNNKRIVVLSEQSLRVMNNAHEIEARLERIESRSAGWDHAFDMLPGLLDRMSSFERTAENVRHFRQRISEMANGSMSASELTRRETSRFAQLHKKDTQPAESLTREVNCQAAVSNDRNLTVS